jgi:hypothetical protein
VVSPQDRLHTTALVLSLSPQRTIFDRGVRGEKVATHLRLQLTVNKPVPRAVPLEAYKLNPGEKADE